MTPTLRALTSADEVRIREIEALLERHRGRPNTARTLSSALRSIARLFPEEGGDIATLRWELAVDPLVFDEMATRINAAVAPVTAQKYLWALRSLLRHLARHELADREVLAATLEDLRKHRLPDPPETRALRTDELTAMLLVCRHDPNRARGARDAALLAMLAGSGPRREELAGVGIEDVSRTDRSVRMQVKGGGERAAALHHAALEHLDEWLRFHPASAGPLFTQINKSGLVVTGAAIGGEAVYRIVCNRRDQAGVDPAVTPHSFRRWFVTSLLEAGVDLFTVMRAVGHRRPSTTQRYDRRGDQVVRDAVQVLCVPTIDDLVLVDLPGSP